MKFICKDLWATIYKKQIDNLRTNHQVSDLSSPFQVIVVVFRQRKFSAVYVISHEQFGVHQVLHSAERSARDMRYVRVVGVTYFQGVFVLQDNNFKLLSHISIGKQYLDLAPRVSSPASQLDTKSILQ